MEDFDRMFAIHVKSSFLQSKRSCGMKERRRRIINISSIWGMNGADTASTIRRQNLLSLTKAWAKLAPNGTSTSTRCAGGVITEMPIRVQGLGQDTREEEGAARPVGPAEEVSGAVAFLASGASTSSPAKPSVKRRRNDRRLLEERIIMHSGSSTW